MDIDRIDPNTQQLPLVVPRQLVDFDVIATDGRAAKVHRESATNNDDSHLVVRVRPWPFSRKRSIPTSAVKRISYGGRQVFVQMTKTQVKNAPQFVPHSASSASNDWGGHTGPGESQTDYDGLLRR